jgi:Spy/CpxP family protein refolding chaperone
MLQKKILTLALLTPLSLVSIAVMAQQPDGAGPPPPSSSGRMGNGMGKGPGMDRGMGDRGGFRFGSMGMWWKNPELAQKIGLTADQQKKMDDIFQQSRLQLIDLRASLEKEEVKMEPMLAANPPDTNRVLAQIDKTAQARAELEKANARMLLGIRNVLTPDQWTKLQAERGSRHSRMRGQGGQGGPGGPGNGGPGGPPPGGESMLAPGAPDDGHSAMALLGEGPNAEM